MTNNKMALAGLAGGITFFLLGFIIYVLLLGGFFEGEATTNIMRPEDGMVWWALVIGNLALGYLFAYVFGNWAGIRTLAGGAKGGAILGGLYALGFDMMMYGTSNVMSLTGTIVDVLVWVVMGAAAGAVVGWVLGRGE